jgi:hypothetical protein
MKKYLKLSFDGVTYFEYSDSLKQTIKMSIMMKNDNINDLMTIFFEEAEVENQYLEFVSRRAFQINANEGFEDKKIDLNSIEFSNASLTECSRREVLSYIKRLSNQKRLTTYIGFMDKLFVESPESYEKLNNKQVSLDIKSVEEVSKTVSNIKKQATESILAQKRKESILLRFCKGKDSK